MNCTTFFQPAPQAASAASMFLNTCTHCASKSSAPTTLPALSLASCPAMKSHSEAFFTRVICEYWPSGFPRPSGLKIVISAGMAFSSRWVRA